MIPWLETDTPFPDVSEALTTDAPGLLAAGADLSPARLLLAYRQGIFPWFSEGQPILWWSTDPRMVLKTADLRISASLKKTLRKVERSRTDGGPWEIRFDSAFEDVMRACAAPRRDGPGTWISDDIIAGYTGLHEQGYAHSSEVWLTGGRRVWRGHRRHVLRRIDVCARHRRVKNRAGVYGGLPAQPRRADDRLPAGDRPPRVARCGANFPRQLPGPFAPGRGAAIDRAVAA
jgi:hypothetical protein